MTSIETSPTDIRLPEGDVIIDDAQLAAVAFLARYSGRTLDAYRHDLRGFFQWASDNNLDVLAATSAHRAVGSTGLWTTFVEGGKGSGGAPSIHACAGRTGPPFEAATTVRDLGPRDGRWMLRGAIGAVTPTPTT